jgi:hypothetical protein
MHAGNSQMCMPPTSSGKPRVSISSASLRRGQPAPHHLTDCQCLLLHPCWSALPPPGNPMEVSKRAAMPLLLVLHAVVSLAEAGFAAWGSALLAAGVATCVSPVHGEVSWQPRAVLIALVASTWAFLLASWWAACLTAYLLPAACCLLPAACCLLPAACCLLLAACCLLRLLPAACCGCCLLPAACCLLPAACCLLSTQPSCTGIPVAHHHIITVGCGACLLCRVAVKPSGSCCLVPPATFCASCCLAGCWCCSCAVRCPMWSQPLARRQQARRSAPGIWPCWHPPGRRASGACSAACLARWRRRRQAARPHCAAWLRWWPGQLLSHAAAVHHRVTGLEQVLLLWTNHATP